VRELIRSTGAKLFFLPKYSPDLNPIEQAFAKLKHLLRKANARSVEAISATISRILRTCSRAWPVAQRAAFEAQIPTEV